MMRWEDGPPRRQRTEPIWPATEPGLGAWFTLCFFGAWGLFGWVLAGWFRAVALDLEDQTVPADTVHVPQARPDCELVFTHPGVGGVGEFYFCPEEVEP